MYAGIDPGKRGSIFVIDEKGFPRHQWVMPLLDDEIDLEKLCSMIFNLKELGVTHVVMEEPQIMFGVNKSSMGKMFRVIGNLESSLMCNGIPFILVRPKTWQKVIWTNEDIVHKEPKKSSLNAAIRIFPNHTQWYYGDNEKNNGRRSKINDNIVDAALIAHYCKQLNQKP